MNGRRRQFLCFMLMAPFVRLAIGAEVIFRRVAVAKLAGTSLQGELSVAPRKLVQVFGTPTEEPWDPESLGAFYFEGLKAGLFTVYRRAYDVDARSIAKLKQSFWAEGTLAEFSIGAREAAGVAEFQAWLAGRLS